jgi:hypothetical protein
VHRNLLNGIPEILFGGQNFPTFLNVKDYYRALRKASFVRYLTLISDVCLNFSSGVSREFAKNNQV